MIMAIIYSIAGIFLALAFHLLYVSASIPYSYINILFFVLAPSSLFYSKKASRFAAAALWLTALPVSLFVYGVDIERAIPPLAFFTLFQACFVYCKESAVRVEKAMESGLRKENLKKNALESELRKIVSFESGMKQKEQSIVALYELTKKMSACLKFGEIFEIFSAFLKDSFSFRKSDLLILGVAGDGLRVERVYSVWRAGTESAYSDRADYGPLIRLFQRKGRHEVFVVRPAQGAIFDELGVSDKAVESLAAVPLYSEGALAAILVVENLPREELEKFVILSMQLALEIKKATLYEIVERLAITDSLTGLYVRRYFSIRLDEELQRSRSYKFNFAFIMFDIDDFKKCNDTYGHLVGDAVLRDIARLIKENIREIDLAARYGGEEFAVLLPETDAAGALLVAERIRKMMAERPFKAYDEEVRLTVSAGISAYPKDSADSAGIVERSDRALYEAKRSGKNVVMPFKK